MYISAFDTRLQLLQYTRGKKSGDLIRIQDLSDYCINRIVVAPPGATRAQPQCRKISQTIFYSIISWIHIAITVFLRGKPSKVGYSIKLYSSFAGRIIFCFNLPYFLMRLLWLTKRLILAHVDHCLTIVGPHLCFWPQAWDDHAPLSPGRKWRARYVSRNA